MIKASELSMLEVINVFDGKRLGPIKDVELDPSNGTVRTLILTGEGRDGMFFGKFGRGDNDFIVPWEHVKKIGQDVVLVELEDLRDNLRISEMDSNGLR